MRQLYALARVRNRSEADYRAFQAFQASLILAYLRRHGCDVAGQCVVDLGSGVGGYSEEMARRGARVFSVDLMAHAVEVQGSTRVTAGAQATPFRTASVDLVFCASLIEHVVEPGLIMQEIERVLKPGGWCYLSFPPFYGPTGGHEYAPFHYLGERLALRLARERSRRGHPDWARRLYPTADTPDSFAGIYDDWGLYVMTIAKARRLIGQRQFDLIDQSTRYLPYGFDKWPGVGEFLTWHVQFLLRRRPVSRCAGDA